MAQGTGRRLAVAPSADSRSPLATGTHDEPSRHGFRDCVTKGRLRGGAWVVSVA